MKRLRAFYNACRYLIGNRKKYYGQFKKDYQRDIEIQSYARELKNPRYYRKSAIHKIGDIVTKDGVVNFVPKENC